MKKLIAQRPIQYMGRTYERGEAIPAQDPKMVAAWLKANSAAWTGTDMEEFAHAVVREAARRSKVNDMAAEAIRAMGVTVEDDAGEFVGAASMEEQIRALFAPGSLQNGGNTGEGRTTATAETPPRAARTRRERVKTAKLGVDVSAAKNQRERAQLIAAAEVQAPANDPDNVGGAQ